jgi:hypothetical protein
MSSLLDKICAQIQDKPATKVHANGSARLVCRWRVDAEGRLTMLWRCHDRDEPVTAWPWLTGLPGDRL